MTYESNEPGYRVAVVGATGAVGREMLEILAERDFPVATLRPMASPRSAGRTLPFRDGEATVEDLAEASFEDIDIALFSPGSSVSEEHAPRAVEQGAIVIDNTSAFRMDDGVPLVVPEVNGELLEAYAEDANDGSFKPGIIANPNCSTIQMVVALQPLEAAVGLERVVCSTYQSASGAGQSGITELYETLRAWANEEEEPEPETFAHRLAFDNIPHIGSFTESGYTTEELKMTHETRKIMDLPVLDVTATCVRVPVVRSHSETLTVDLKEELSPDEARAVLSEAPGLKVYDEPSEERYPLAQLAEGNDDTWVGRLRRDIERPKTLHFWCVSDNLRKGAALNAVQIAEALAA